MAVEAQGAAAARPWLERAGATFPTVVDAENLLGEALGYKVIPNGIVLDETGRVRFQKFGGFSVANAADVEAVERVLAMPAEVPARLVWGAADRFQKIGYGSRLAHDLPIHSPVPVSGW